MTAPALRLVDDAYVLEKTDPMEGCHPASAAFMLVAPSDVTEWDEDLDDQDLEPADDVPVVALSRRQWRLFVTASCASLVAVPLVGMALLRGGIALGALVQATGGLELVLAGGTVLASVLQLLAALCAFAGLGAGAHAYATSGRLFPLQLALIALGASLWAFGLGWPTVQLVLTLIAGALSDGLTLAMSPVAAMLHLANLGITLVGLGLLGAAALEVRSR